MDDRGYVIAHRGLVEADHRDPLEPNSRNGAWGPSERKHITHMVRNGFEFLKPSSYSVTYHTQVVREMVEFLSCQ